MRVFRDLSTLPELKKSIITIGSFDGVHTGHQRIIERLKHLSKEYNCENIVVTFHPHPRSIVYPKDKSLKLLSSLQEKINLFEKYGVDNVVIVPFTIEFSQLSAQEYIQNFLVSNFNPHTIVIGYDHKFGLNRSGDIRLLRSEASAYDYEVIEISKQEIDEITISSTQIRTALLNGDLVTANTLLNHPYEISGTVIRGRKLGTEIGFPTANLSVEEKNKLVPKDGIYTCRVRVDKKVHDGMLYIGDIPTIGTDNPKSIEVNIFDFNDDIYDKRIGVQILHYLRDDQKFEGLTALKAQLIKDRENSLKFFEKYNDVATPKCSIAILNYNTQHFLENFLPSVSFSSEHPFETVVIDNASDDDSVSFVNEWFPEIKTVQLNKNYGFAKGYNLGLKEIDSEYLVLLNSDVQVTKNWVDPILEFLDANPEYAAAMPKILSFEDKKSFEYAGASGGYIDYMAYPFCRGRIFDEVEKDEGQYDDVQSIFWASGAALVIRKDLFVESGGFDSKYFAHMEEIDLCWRLHNAGYKIGIVPQSKVYHLGGGTLDYGSSKKVYLNFRNNLFTIFKNESVFNLVWKIPFRLILDGVASIKFLFSGNPKSMFAVLKAHLSFYVNVFSLIGKRRHNKKWLNAKGSKMRNKDGMISKSILMQYYILGKRKYSEIISS